MSLLYGVSTVMVKLAGWIIVFFFTNCGLAWNAASELVSALHLV